MFCSGCGQEMAVGQAFCGHCGRPSAGPVPPVPGLQFQLENYAGKVRTLSIFWFVYAAVSLLLGFLGLQFAHAFLSGAFGNLMRGPMPPEWLFGPAFIHLVWATLIVRAGLAFAAAWGLLEHAQWGRVVAIIAAILSLIKFPFGTAMGIWTLVMLLGYRNATLYEQL
jgi:hypothetical protein